MKQSVKDVEREAIIIKMLANTQGMRVQKIWNEVKSLPVFSSKRDVWDTLDYLVEHSRKVTRLKISHKLVIYALAVDTDFLERLRHNILELDNFFPKVREDLKKSKDDNNLERVTFFYKMIIFKELSKFLNAINIWVEVDDKWKEVVGFFISKYNVDCFSVILKDCKESNAEAFNNAFGSISESLNLSGSEMWNNFKAIK